MSDGKDIPEKFVWRKWKSYRNGKIALKVCPTCLKTQVARNMRRCPSCGQLLEWNDDELNAVYNRALTRKRK